MQIVMSWLGILRKIGQKAGPYLVLEMLLPGGTLFALLLFLWQRRRPDIGSGAQRAVHCRDACLAPVPAQRILVRAPLRETSCRTKIAYPRVTLGRG